MKVNRMLIWFSCAKLQTAELSDFLVFVVVTSFKDKHSVKIAIYDVFLDSGEAFWHLRK